MPHLLTSACTACGVHLFWVEPDDKNIDDTDLIIGANEIIQMLREQRALFAILAFDKALHLTSVVMRYWLNVF